MSLGIGLQLFSIKDETAKDFVGALRRVAEIGYDGVEFAGYGGLSSDELKKLLDELNLVPCGSHVGIDQLVNDIDEVIKYNLEIGNKYIICPYAEFSSAENVKDIISKLSVAAHKCSEKGLKLGYHNHDHEFNAFDGKLGLDILLSSIEDDQIFCELDTYWVYYAGIDPALYINRHTGRFELLHIKDMQVLPNGEKESTEVGNGIMDFKPIIEVGRNQGTKWMIVEQEYFTMPVMESVKICYDNLKKLI